IEFFFGSMRAGAIPLPLDTRLAAGTLEHIIVEAACALALIDPSSHRDARAIAQRLPLRQRLILGQRRDGVLAFEAEMANPYPPSLPTRLLLATAPKRSTPTRPDRPAAPRARS